MSAGWRSRASVKSRSSGFGFGLIEARALYSAIVVGHGEKERKCEVAVKKGNARSCAEKVQIDPGKEFVRSGDQVDRMIAQKSATGPMA